MTTAILHDNILTIKIPIGFKRRSYRKMFVAPDGGEIFPELKEERKIDKRFVEALYKAFTWQEKLENKRYENAKEMAEKEDIDLSYMYRTMRLILLSPDIIEAVLNGKQPPTLTLQQVVRGFPISWQEQRKAFGFPQPE